MRALLTLCLLALVPFLSLVLGPLLAYRAHRFRRRAADPNLTGAVPVGIAFWLGVCSGTASWLGLGVPGPRSAMTQRVG